MSFMKTKLTTIIDLCKHFYKAATLEEDMAKRIMLSVIPAAMNKTEMGATKGFDYKALRSAANGAKDLVKYGTRACAVEMNYYLGAGGQRAKMQSLTSEGRYKDALELAVAAFQDVSNWDRKFGGTAWAKIADTLLQIEVRRQQLEQVRAATSSPEPGRDYLSEEVELMKEIITYMNVFDGLAHNTASVMPKVVERELEDRNTHKVEDYEEREDRMYFDRKYQRRIQRMMDAKEIDDPFVVYRELQPTIEQPQFKHLFKDWIDKIHTLPEYAAAPSLDQKKQDIAVIKARKALKSALALLEETFQPLVSAKDQVLMIRGDQQKLEDWNNSTINVLHIFMDTLGDFESVIVNAVETDKNKDVVQKYSNLYEFVKSLALSRTANRISNKLHDTKYDGTELNITDFMSDIATLKRGVSSLKNAIDQYIG